MTYLADVAALAKKDLLLELRSRDTLPAMLLFVVSTLVVFHFSLPSGSSGLAAAGLLWVAIVFTALLGLTRAFVAEREQRLMDGLVLAPCDRSAIWLGKSIATLAFASTKLIPGEAGKFKDAVIYTISMDLPFAQARYCGAHAIANLKTLSDYKEASFGDSYGVLIKELRLLARSIFILDKDDTVRYVEYVKEVSEHPSYEAALEAARKLGP